MSDKNRHMFSDNYRNTILDPVINQAPLSFLTFQCGECGTKFINYKSKVIHQKNYCIKANENSDIEKDLLRLRSIDYVSKPITPVIPLGLEYGSAAFTTKYSQPYIYDRMFKKYDHYKKPTLTQYSIYDYDDELSRELYTPTLDSHRVRKEFIRIYYKKNLFIILNRFIEIRFI